MSSNLYSKGFGTTSSSSFTSSAILSQLSPTSSDVKGPNGQYNIGQLWVNKVSGASYQLVSLSTSNKVLTATWNLLGTGASTLFSWTPIVAGSSSAGVGTYTTQSGYYTYIGNMIFVQAHIDWSAHTGTGNMTITNLPANCYNAANYDPEGICNPTDITLPAGISRTVLSSILAGTNTVNLYVTTNAGANAAVQMGSAGSLHLNIYYFT